MLEFINKKLFLRSDIKTCFLPDLQWGHVLNSLAITIIYDLKTLLKGLKPVHTKSNHLKSDLSQTDLVVCLGCIVTLNLFTRNGQILS